MSKDIQGLRDRLFDLLDGVRSGEVEVETAKTMVRVADSIIDTARVENDFLRATENIHGTGFISTQRQQIAPPQIERGMAGVAKQLQAIR